MPRHTIGEFPSQEPELGFWGKHNVVPEYLRSPVPETPWDQRLLNHMENHLESEGSTEGSYEALAELGDPQVKYLARLFGADERRHHQMLIDLMASVRAVADWKRDQSSWATTPLLEEGQRASLVKAVDELIRVEKSDAADLKLLRRDVQSHSDGTFWPTIIEVMQLDTEKHLRILLAIKRSLKHRPVRRASAESVAGSAV